MATATDTDQAPLPAAPRFFYALADIDDEGVEILHSVHETIDAAAGILGRREKIRRCVFGPLDSEKRFRVTRINWFPADETEPLDYAIPQSPFDLPPGQSVETEWLHIEKEIVGRADGLAEVARKNRALMAQPRDALGRDWAVLIELGQPVPGVDIYLKVTPGWVGCEKREVEYPIRIVTPTAEEVEAEKRGWHDELLDKRFPSRKKEATKKQAAKRKAR
jgi:hypothetical protein